MTKQKVSCRLWQNADMFHSVSASQHRGTTSHGPPTPATATGNSGDVCREPTPKCYLTHHEGSHPGLWPTIKAARSEGVNSFNVQMINDAQEAQSTESGR